MATRKPRTRLKLPKAKPPKVSAPALDAVVDNPPALPDSAAKPSEVKAKTAKLDATIADMGLGTPASVSAEKDKPSFAPKAPPKAPKAALAATPKPPPPKKAELKIESPVLVQPDEKPPMALRTKRVRSIVNDRIVYGSFEARLVKDMNYTMPTEIADILIKSGRCV